MAYNQFRAMLAIAKGSFKAILRSPATVAFSLGFPFIFIIGFGFINKDKGIAIPVGYSAADTANAVFPVLKNIPGLELLIKDSTVLREDLQRNRITAIVQAKPDGTVQVAAPEFANASDISVLHTLLQHAFNKEAARENTANIVSNDTAVIRGRQSKLIDFLLPGMLGFALLGTGIFSVAFLFFNLRQELVLKRFFATPITKTNILLGETLSQAVFQLLSAALIIFAGVWLYGFTLHNGLSGFLQIMVVCFITLIVFMGFGFVVSGMSKTSGSVPALANIFAIPQFLLSGTFYPVEKFPEWLQPFCKMLPLTHFNEAVRSIAFDGASLWDCRLNIGMLILWGLIIFFAAARVFRWE